MARRAGGEGARLGNDVCALRREPTRAAAVAETGVPVILMHNGSTPAGKDLVTDIRAGLEESLSLASRAGIDHDRILVDPGIGFGKTRDGNLEIIRRLPEFRALGWPILIGPSRKSFIGKTPDLPVDRRPE